MGLGFCAVIVTTSVSTGRSEPCPLSTVDLNVARYRTEKPSKSPPPPPPRRSFPSAHGLTTNRTGEVIVAAKNLKVRESEIFFDEGELKKETVILSLM